MLNPGQTPASAAVGTLRMAFGPVFPRVFSPTFDRHAAAAAAAPAWWEVAGKTCVAAYQAKGAADYATSLVNLANPGTNDAAEGVAPGWSIATGWVFSGSEYLLSGAVPTSQASSMLVQFSDGPTSGFAVMCGQLLLYTAAVGLSGCWGGANSIYWNGTDGVSLLRAPELVSGNLAYAGLYAYRDGVAESGSFESGWAGTFSNIQIGGSVSGQEAWAGKVHAYAFYSDTLTAGEVATVSSAMSSL